MNARLSSFATAAAVALSALGAAAPAAAVLVVDDFAAPQPAALIARVGLGSADLATNDASIFGVERLVTWNTYTNPLSSVAVLGVGGGQLSAATGVGGQSEAVVAYGAFTRPAGPLQGGPLWGLDLRGQEAARLVFTGVSTTLNINVVLYTNAPLNPGNPLYYVTAGLNFAPAAPGGPMTAQLDFDRSQPFNFAQVDGAVFIVDRATNQTGVAWTLDRFEFAAPIPEPGTWALMAAGLGAVGWAARRRRAATA